MKFVKARDGENFVFPDRGGIWKKTGDATAELVFPSVKAGPARKCSGINPQLNVYVIFERDAKESKTGQVSPGMKIVMIDRDTEKPVLEIVDATAQQVAAYSYSEELKMTPKGKRKVRDYDVDEVIMDHDSQSLVLIVRDVTDKTMKVVDI